MARSLFLLIIMNLIGALMNPLILAATDTVAVNGLSDARVVETVLPEPEPEPVVAPAPAVLAPAAGAASTAPASAPQGVNYRVTIYSDEIKDKDLSYGDIYKTNKLVYAHNTANLMGNLSSLGVGAVFTVTEGGVTTSYKVSNVVVYEKNVVRGNGVLQRNGQGSYMRSVMNAIDKDTGAPYDLALMTCSGRALGGGDATHRLVVFANAI